ncbi:MAG: rRNA maturation RNase YbeY [marine benthic group bacterium]|nr:rRNA maturation RNase YbeY [Gemmatimonadota bacterium]
MAPPPDPPDSDVPGTVPPASGLVVHVNGLEAWPGEGPTPAAVVRAARAALALGGRERPGELSISFIDDDEISRLNQEGLGRDDATDVIAFSLGRRESLLGDVYISAETGFRNAAELGVPPGEELLRLVIHGTLHVLGHDHPEGAGRESSDMYRLQEELLRSLGSG